MDPDVLRSNGHSLSAAEAAVLKSANARCQMRAKEREYHLRENTDWPVGWPSSSYFVLLGRRDPSVSTSRLPHARFPHSSLNPLSSIIPGRFNSDGINASDRIHVNPFSETKIVVQGMLVIVTPDPRLARSRARSLAPVTSSVQFGEMREIDYVM
jgi:hypothetical protein